MRLWLPLLCGFLSSAASADGQRCGQAGVALEVLGSGGPDFADGRASASYLLWRDGRPVLLIDAGGGSAPHFAASGAKVQDLRAILLTHLHVDHVADLPALIKLSYFEERKAPLPVFGPAGNDLFPSTRRFLEQFFGRRGAFRYLAEFVRGDEGGYRLEARVVEPAQAALAPLLQEGDLAVFAGSVVHGPVPALAFRIEVAGKVIAISGDTSGEGALVEVARGADLFIAHHAIPEDLPGSVRKLHMSPSRIGEIAAQAGVKRLVLAHRMQRTRGKEALSKAAIAEHWKGEVELAEDRGCLSVH